MITYNHEKFVAQAIESVLMQETDFLVELIIGEDCSTDDTREIVRRYANIYPQVIRLLLPEQNLGPSINSAEVRKACRGEFIAVLEGDDYWIDPLKLAKQVSLMNLHPNYSMCGTADRVVLVLPNGKEEEVDWMPSVKTDMIYNLQDVLVTLPFRTLTFMLRNGMVKFPDWFEKVKFGDICVPVLYAEKGPIAYLSDVTATYRIHGGGIWSGTALSGRCNNYTKALEALNDHFSGRYVQILRKRDFDNLRFLCLEALAKGGTREVKNAYWKSFTQFALHMPIPYLHLGFLVYGNKFISAYHRITMRIAIRTRLNKLLDRILGNWLRSRVNEIILSEFRVWGDKKKLSIAPTAVVNNALFNLSSGTITIGEFVFFGHNVAVLTGTHDISKFNQERQFSAPGSGRDISIGEGTWIASNVTLLGPCKIGKHCVVAAGAVVRSDIPDFCVYAGVPAVLLKELPRPV